MNRSKGDLLEARGKNRMDYKAFDREEKVLEVQVYGERYYLDVEGMLEWLKPIYSSR